MFVSTLLVRCLAPLAFVAGLHAAAHAAAPLAVFECREPAGRDWPRTLVTYDLATAAAD